MPRLSPETMQEIIALAGDMAGKFSAPELIVGCEVMDITDVNLYATNNGWVEAVCGKHNQQRCRWKGNYSGVQVGDFVDVLYFFGLFEVLRKGGTGAITPAAAAGWPADEKAMIDQTEYATLTAALAAVGAGETIKLGAGDFNEQVTITTSCKIEGTGIDSTVIYYNDTEVVNTRASVTFENLTIKNINDSDNSDYSKALYVNSNGTDEGDVIAINCRFIFDGDIDESVQVVRIDGGGDHEFIDCYGYLENADLSATNECFSAGLADSVLIRGGHWSGIDYDLIAYSTVTSLILRSPAFVNDLVSIDSAVDVDGHYLDDKNNIVQPGAGNDAYLYGDEKPVFNRISNWGQIPTDHWSQGADDATWTGWAAYTGFVTPSSIIRAESNLTVGNSSQARWFYYRPYVNAQTALLARTWANYRSEAGLMVDDGVDTGDGYGADNYYRIMIQAATGLGSMFQIVTEYRTGGGAQTQNTYFTNFMPNFYVGLRLVYGIGTRWTNWGGAAYLYSEYGAGLASQLFQYLGAAAWTWTPARIGLYGRVTDASGGTDKRSFWDTYIE